MPPSIFTAKEREFIASYLEEWLELSGAGKVRDGDGELFSPKDELVDTIKLDFFVAFPERELLDGAQSPTAFSIPDRDRLHTRIKHILYNAAAKQDRLDSQRSQGPTLSRHTAYLTLFKQQYRTEIMQRRDAHLPDGTPKEKLIAYNQAVQEERKYREAICPEEIHELKAQAQNIRAQAKLPFHRQSSEVQAIVLDNLPSDIARAMRGWEHQTGAHIFLTAVWSNEKHEATVFDYSTRNAKGFLTSENAKDAQQAWHMWLEQFKGDLLNKATEVPKEEIYANAAGLPMLPEIYGSRVSMADQKKLMRRYFECWSMTRGGGKVPYARIERDMRKDPASWIDPARMPPGVHTLTDIKVWTRDNLNSWILHLLRGQRAELPANQVFAFAQVPCAEKLGVLHTNEPAVAPVDGAECNWTIAEQHYTEYMRTVVAGDTGFASQLLPPARRTHVYCPFAGDLLSQLRDVHKQDHAFLNLLHEVEVLEELGPLHNSEGMSNSEESGSLHVPLSTSPSLARSLCPADWLLAAFFDPKSPSHSRWSIETFRCWIHTTRPHVHQPTGTVYGGPLGVRVVVFALSRMLQNIHRGSLKESAPKEVSRHLKKQRLKEMLQLINDCVTMVHNDVQGAMSVLRKSLEGRQNQWTTLVRQRAEEDYEGDDLPETGISAMSGVPRSKAVLKDMVAALLELETRNYQVVSKPAQPQQRRAHAMVVSDEESGEEIDITAQLGLFISYDDAASERNQEHLHNTEALSQQLEQLDLEPSPALFGDTAPLDEALNVDAEEVTEDPDIQDSSAQDGLRRRRSGRRPATKPEHERAMAELRKKSPKRR